MKQKTNWLSHYSNYACVFCNWLANPNKAPQLEVTSNDSSWAMFRFVKADSINPILLPGANSFFCPILKQEVMWEEKDVFNPAVVVREGKVYMLFRAEDKIGKYAGTSRIGLAMSEDGLALHQNEGARILSG